MNKKFLSAILFGALMVTSTGTFVSCKDYDDDIDRIDNTLNDLKSQLAALQKLVGEGKWVTSISSIENGFTVTMSDGSSQTVKGINGKDGVDGKNGTEWSIGEDGFWYKDGEKTTSQAVAKDGENGKPGATAPSPSINADGYWVIYEWDATAGEFVAKTSEISAKGTNAYVVAKDGVYVLNIANEKGEFVQVTLPATADSFVAEAPAGAVLIAIQTATWNPTAKNTSDAAKKAFKKLTDKFTEIAAIEKGSTVKQGGELPLLVNPGNVELTDKFTFSLQLANGKTPEIALSNPVVGIAEDWAVLYGTMLKTRAAEAQDCFWTLDVEPAYNEKTKKYASTEEQSASLVIENEKGNVVKTAFAYTVEAAPLEANDNIDVEAGVVTYAPSIDLSLVDAETQEAGINYSNEYKGYSIVTLADDLNVEQYGLTLEGNVLSIATMPTNVSSIIVELNVVALGLNGSAIEEKISVTVQQSIQVAGGMADKSVTLAIKKDGSDKYTQNVLWDVADFKFVTATQKNAFYESTKTLSVYAIDENGDKAETVFKTYTAGSLLQTQTDGVKPATSYSDFAKFGFTLDAADYAPGTYAIELVAKDGDAIIVKSEATMTVANPKAEDIFSLVPDFTTDGVLQVIGDYADVTNKITYDLAAGIITPDFVSADPDDITYIDADHKAWDEAMGADTEMGAENWIKSNKLEVYKNAWNGAATPANEYMLNKDRNIRATYKLYGNENNTIDFNFKVNVKSSVWTKDGSNVAVKAIATNFGKAVNMTSNISATYALGINKGKALNLFGTQTTTKDYTNSVAKDANGFVTKNGMPVEIARADLITLGMTADVFVQLKDEKFYLTKDNSTAQAVQVAGSAVNLSGWDDIKATSATDKALYALVVKYGALIDYTEGNEPASTTIVDPSKISDEIQGVTFAWDNAKLADKFIESVDLTNGAIVDGKFTAKAADDIQASDLVNGKAVLKVNMKVTDKWGMVMTKTYDVTITKK